MSTKIALWDIDGTLADDSHRKPYFHEKNYVEYFNPARMLADPVIAESADELFTLLSTGWDIGFATARRERNREVTERWLGDAGMLGTWPVFMRPDESTETPAEFKSYVVRVFLDNYDRVLFYEDDVEVYNALRREFGENIVYLVPWAPA